MRTDRIRLGIPTASNFHHIITPGGKPVDSRERKRYLYRLIYERIVGEEAPEPFQGNEHTERGINSEESAAAAFMVAMKLDHLLPGKFITTDDGNFGCTPDRILPNRSEAVEIKSPSGPIHIGHMVDGPGDKYRPQVQGQLLIGEFETVHFWSWHHHRLLTPVHIRTHRDERYINTLRELLDRFDEELHSGEMWVRRQGNLDEVMAMAMGEPT